jgi:hypothetical protein
MGEAFEIQALQRAYRDASTTPTEVISRLHPLLAQEKGMFITLATLESLLERCRYRHPGLCTHGAEMPRAAIVGLHYNSAH